MPDMTSTDSKARSLRQRLAGLFRARTQPRSRRMVAYNTSRGMPLAKDLEVADNPFTRRKGLLGRDGLAPGSGLWIFPCESVHTFGMHFSIDLVYLNRKYVVKKVRKNVPPGRLSVCWTARSILELPAGVIEATGTARGDQISITQPS